MRLPLVFLAVLAGVPACGDDSSDDDDSDGDPADVDGGTDGGSDGGGGLGATVTWRSRPTIPGEADDGITVTSMRYGMSDLRLVGDIGAVAFDRTELAWSTGVAPMPDIAADAPAGVYSSLLATITRGNGTYAWEIAGSANGTPYVLRDTQPLALSISFRAITLPAGGSFSVGVRMRVEDVIEDLDFGELENRNGTLGFRDNDPQLPGVRATIVDNFSISDD